MVDKKEIAKDIGLTVITGPFGKLGKALTQALKKHKEAKDKKEKARLQKLIDDLKSEIKLKKGDRGAAEAMPKLYEKPIRKIKEKHPLDKRKPFGGAKFRLMKTGGSVKTSKYSKGGGVRKSKYSL